jgi:iron only hydrogenase large subunit-like protein
MNHRFPVYTVQNECHDCYKCIRHCPSKAIKIKDGRASVIPELCVACGICVKICPAGAKRIRNDVSRAKFIIANEKKVIAALAPAWRSAFKGIHQNQLVDALKKLGFDAVSEVALGAQAVSAATAQYLDAAPYGLYISSACPAAVDYIRKYIPEHTVKITDFISPALTHAKMLKNHFGKNSKVIFFGPCAAKKQEAATHPDIMTLALTFNNLIDWLDDENININKMPGIDIFEPDSAAEGRLYALEGGMLDTIRTRTADTKTHFLALSGLHNIERTLAGDYSENIKTKLFVECLACEGGCINGPGMPKNCSRISDIMTIAGTGETPTAKEQCYDIDIKERITPEWIVKSEISEKELTLELAKIGKYTAKDELNCGGCGYQSCRCFAKAVIEEKAERSMCLSHLRKLAQKKSNALIKHIPAGVVIADRNLSIIQCNIHFSRLFDESTKLAFEAKPGLEGVSLKKVVNFIDLFEVSLSTGQDVIRNNFSNGAKIFNVTIFTVEPHQIVGAIIQDVTLTEIHREQIASKAKTVIRKNVMTVQKIANYLGEHMAETESLLREVATGYDTPEPAKEILTYEK